MPNILQRIRCHEQHREKHFETLDQIEKEYKQKKTCILIKIKYHWTAIHNLQKKQKTQEQKNKLIEALRPCLITPQGHRAQEIVESNYHYKLSKGQEVELKEIEHNLEIE